MSEREFSIGHGFRDGKLYSFFPPTIEVLRPWGRRFGAWRFRSTRGWHSFVPAISLQNIESLCRNAARDLRQDAGFDEWGQASLFATSATATYEQRKARAYSLFLAEIPARVRALVRPFRSRDWTMLRLANGCGDPYLELLESTPALAFALAAGRVPGSLYRCAGVSAQLRRRQRDTAARLGFPPSESTVHLLRKIPRTTLSRRVLVYLRQALAIDGIRMRMCHLPRLNASVLRILCDPELSGAAAHPFLVEVGSRRRDDRRAHAAWELKETVELLRRMDAHPQVFTSMNQVSEVHARCVERLGGAAARSWISSSGEFPSPPLPEVDGLEAIRSAPDLSVEGREMNHCVASYSADAATGRMYFYRMLRPARATVALRFTGSSWRLSDVRGPSNAEPGHAVREAVRAWLRRAGESDSVREPPRFCPPGFLE